MGKVDAAKWEALKLPGKLPKALTERVIEAVRTHPLGERYALSDGKVPGLSLEVATNGSASFVLRYRTRDGAQRTAGLGSAREVPLVEARAAAEKSRAHL